MNILIVIYYFLFVILYSKGEWIVVLGKCLGRRRSYRKYSICFVKCINSFLGGGEIIRMVEIRISRKFFYVRMLMCKWKIVY